MRLLSSIKKFLVTRIFNEHELADKQEIERDSQLAALRARRLEEFRYLHWR